MFSTNYYFLKAADFYIPETLPILMFLKATVFLFLNSKFPSYSKNAMFPICGAFAMRSPRLRVFPSAVLWCVLRPIPYRLPRYCPLKWDARSASPLDPKRI